MFYKQIALGSDGSTGQEKEVGEFRTTSEMAARLHVTPPTLLKWGRSSRLPFVQLERKVLWHEPSVKAALLRLQRFNGTTAAQ